MIPPASSPTETSDAGLKRKQGPRFPWEERPFCICERKICGKTWVFGRFRRCKPCVCSEIWRAISHRQRRFACVLGLDGAAARGIGGDAEANRISRRGLMNKLELVEHVATEAELTKVCAAAALEAV